MGIKSRGKRKEKAERNRNHIFEIALNLFGKKGFDKTSILDITKKAGVSVGTFYHYFKSKDGILEEQFKRADAGFSQLMESGLPDGSLQDQILYYMDRYAILVQETGLDLTQQIYTYRNKLFIRKGRSMQTGLTDIIRKGQEKGEISDEMSPEETCEYIFVTARGVVLHWCLLDGGKDIRRMMGNHMRKLLRVFFVEEPPASLRDEGSYL